MDRVYVREQPRLHAGGSGRRGGELLGCSPAVLVTSMSTCVSRFCERDASFRSLPSLRPDARARALVPYCRSPHCLHRTFLYHSCTNLRRDARTFLLRPSAWAPRLSERLRFARACLPRSCCSRAHPTPTARLFTRLRAHHRPHTILPKMADARARRSGRRALCLEGSVWGCE